jgi:ADP-ribosylglycohydrolase
MAELTTALDPGIMARAQGCLLGQLAGDALGSMVEFTGVTVIAVRYPGGLRQIGPSPVFGTLAGQPTDDSEMALALARTLVRAGFDEEAVAGAYADWLESDPFDCGNTVGTATRAMATARRHGAPLASAARAAADRGSMANGALMRQSPLAIWGWRLDPLALDRIVRADTSLTHPHVACQDASSAFIVALAAVVREGLTPVAAHERALAWQRAHGSDPAITEALANARTAPPTDYQTKMGLVHIALQNAFYQALRAPSLEAGVVDTVMRGGDTDTNATVAGALLGALHGRDALPAQWADAVLTCRPEQGLPEVRQPRPAMYWPVDALELAVALLNHKDAACDPLAPKQASGAG